MAVLEILGVDLLPRFVEGEGDGLTIGTPFTPYSIRKPSEILATNFFQGYLQNGGSNQMAVDGSSTPVDFTILAPATKKVLITKVSFTLAADINFLQEDFMVVTLSALESCQLFLNTVQIADFVDNNAISIFCDNDGTSKSVGNTDKQFLTLNWKPPGNNVNIGLMLNDLNGLSMKIRANLTGDGQLFRCHVQGILI